MRKFLIAAVLAGTMVAAAPASAAQFGGANRIQAQISQLSAQVARAEQRGAISRREANGLQRQAVQVQRNYRQFSRNGIDRREFAVLQNQVQQIRANLRIERRDVDRRRG
jgi:outer membrane murein-binding lipoprotein Lpp